VDVAGDGVALPEHLLEQDPLGGPALMGGDDVGVPEDPAHGAFEPEEALRPGVGFVGLHHSRPLAVAHGRGAAVRQQVDVDLFGGEPEDVEPGGLEGLLPVRPAGPADGFDNLDSD